VDQYEKIFRGEVNYKKVKKVQSATKHGSVDSAAVTQVAGRCETVADVIVASMTRENSMRVSVSFFMWHGWIREGDEAAWRCNFLIKDYF
jgi:hypothetical protein